MAISKLIAGLFLALVVLAAANTSEASRAEPTPSPAPSPSPSSDDEHDVTSCASWFMGMTPCMDFFTDADVTAPSGTCCKGLEALVDGGAICLCHAMNGDIDNLMPATTDFSRVADLPATCGVALPMETLSKCETEPVPPLLPPSPAA